MSVEYHLFAWDQDCDTAYPVGMEAHQGVFTDLVAAWAIAKDFDESELATLRNGKFERVAYSSEGATDREYLADRYVDRGGWVFLPEKKFREVWREEKPYHVTEADYTQMLREKLNPEGATLVNVDWNSDDQPDGYVVTTFDFMGDSGLQLYQPLADLADQPPGLALDAARANVSVRLKDHRRWVQGGRVQAYATGMW